MTTAFKPQKIFLLLNQATSTKAFNHFVFDKFVFSKKKKKEKKLTTKYVPHEYSGKYAKVPRPMMSLCEPTVRHGSS